MRFCKSLLVFLLAIPCVAQASQPAITLYVDAHGHPVTPFRTRSSTISRAVYGAPANAIASGVAVIGCGISDGSRVSFTLLNERDTASQPVTLSIRLEHRRWSSLAATPALKPNELRTVTIRGAQAASSFECGVSAITTSKAARTAGSRAVTPGSPVVRGVPLNALDAPVLMMSCDATYHGKNGSQGYGAIFRFTVVNRSRDFLRYTRIVTKEDRGASYDEAVLFDLKPHELRTFVLDEEGAAAGGDLPSDTDYPHWMYCSAGPAEKRDGSMIDFEPPLLHR